MRGRRERGDGKRGDGEMEVLGAAPAAAFSGEPLNRVVFAEESWDHPK